MTKTTQSEQPVPEIRKDKAAIPNLTTWIEKHVGGEVVQIERLGRWRPVWRAEIREGSETKHLLIKGERTSNVLPYSLAYEAHMMQVLNANGISQVPYVYGVCENPVAFVMDFLEGERNTDLLRTTSATTSALSDERKAASLHYMDILAKIHGIEPGKFVASGATLPIGAREIALANAERYAVMVSEAGIVEPSLTFAYSWMRRHVPMHRTRCSFVTGDCGQFLNQGAAVTAVLDMEMAHLGDPLHDLACFRGRHPVEDLGDISVLYDRYAKTTGERIDVPTLAYHTVVFLAVGLCATMLIRAERASGGSWVEAAMQVNFIGRRGMEALADVAGVELDVVRLPDQPRVTPTEDLALESLIREIDQLQTSPEFADWQRSIISDIPRFLLNQAHYGQWATEEDLKEIARIVGRKHDDIKQANQALHEFISHAGPEHDTALVRYFHRSFLRQCHLFAGPGAPESHLMFAKMEPILTQ
jgi:aminoglycoside phosphotransferase (APT) family kinase protein